MGIHWPFTRKQPQPLRTVVSTKAEDIKARRKRADVVAQLAVYTAVVPLEQRKADTERFFAQAAAKQ